MTMSTPPVRQGPDAETLGHVLDTIAQNPVLADAMRAVHKKPNTIFSWLQKSRANDPRYLVRWPDSDGAEMQFADAVVLAQRAHHFNFESRLRRDVDVGTPRVLRTQGGDVVYEIDHRLVAEWRGDADAAHTLGGIADPFYLHDAEGARIPVVLYDAAPAALRQHVARALLPGYNPADRQERDTRHSGRVLITGAVGKIAGPSYARPAVKPMSDLQRDLLGRLDAITRDGPVNAKPSAPVNVYGRPSQGDPPERTVEPKRKIALQDHPRRYDATPGKRNVTR
jgi:hypothetical protein